MAQNLTCYSCYDCMDVSDDLVDICPGGQCYTMQVSYSEVDETYYERGCIGSIPDGYEEGCIEQDYNDVQASVCYKTCAEEKCNTDTKLSGSSSMTTSSILALILCYMM